MSSRTASGVRVLGNVGAGADEPAVGVVGAAEPRLHRRAGGLEPRADRGVLGPTRSSASRSASRQPSRSPLPRRAEASSTSRSRRASSCSGPSGSRRSAGAEPAGRGGGRARCRRAAGVAQDPHGLRVAARGGVLDVVRALDGGRAAGGERVGGAAVRGEPPAALRPLVDRAPHELVAEGEPPRDLGGLDELAVEQLVERVERRRLGHLGYLGHEVGLEALARHGRRLQQARASSGRAAISCASAVDTTGGTSRRPGRPLPPLGASRPRARAAPCRTGCRRRARRPAALRLGHAAVEHPRGVLLAERAEPDEAGVAAALRGADGRGELVGELRGAPGEDEHHRGGGRLLDEGGEQLDRGVVGPVQVVDGHDDGLRAREALEQHRAPRGRSGSARRGCGAPSRGHRRARGRSPRARLAPRPRGRRGARARRRQLRVERVDDRGEGHVALELGGGAAQHDAVQAAARAHASSSSRVFPIPASPEISTSRGSPPVTPFSAPSSRSSSASLPTMGSTTVATGAPSAPPVGLRQARYAAPVDADERRARAAPPTPGRRARRAGRSTRAATRCSPSRRPARPRRAR